MWEDHPDANITTVKLLSGSGLKHAHAQSKNDFEKSKQQVLSINLISYYFKFLIIVNRHGLYNERELS